MMTVPRRKQIEMRFLEENWSMAFYAGDGIGSRASLFSSCSKRSQESPAQIIITHGFRGFIQHMVIVVAGLFPSSQWVSGGPVLWGIAPRCLFKAVLSGISIRDISELGADGNHSRSPSSCASYSSVSSTLLWFTCTADLEHHWSVWEMVREVWEPGGTGTHSDSTRDMKAKSSCLSFTNTCSHFCLLSYHPEKQLRRML